MGLPLDAGDPEDVPLHPVKGFMEHDSSLVGVVISHPHQDHYGLAHRLPAETPFLIGKAAEAILVSAALFSPAGMTLKNVSHLMDRSPIQAGPFTITPFLVDHSAYDSYAILVEADGRRLFYTGDFRAHGRKSFLTDRLIANPPKNVNILLMEGTCIGRNDRPPTTEDELVPQLAEIFRKTEGLPLVWCSGQNIDRIVTIFKACREAKRQFIVDVYTAEILKATDNPRLPQADWNGIQVFLPTSQWLRLKKEESSEISDSYLPHRISMKSLAGAAARSVMLFRPSMVRDLERADCLDGGCVVCSVWEGYLQDQRNGWFLDWMRSNSLPVHCCHTSGHASIQDLRRMREAFADAAAVPVHLLDRNRFVELFQNVTLHDDGEWWNV